MKSLIYTVCITRYCMGLFCKKEVRNITTLIYAHLYFYLYTVLLPLPPFSFFGFCLIFGAAKTEKPVPRSFFPPKPHRNACYYTRAIN